MGRSKDTVMNNGKPHTQKQSKTSNSVTTFKGQAVVHPLPGKKGSSIMEIWEKASAQMCHPSSLFPQLYLLNMMPYNTGNPRGELGSAVLAGFPPNSLYPQPSCCQGGVRSRKSLDDVQWLLNNNQNYPCVINTVSTQVQNMTHTSHHDEN